MDSWLKTDDESEQEKKSLWVLILHTTDDLENVHPLIPWIRAMSTISSFGISCSRDEPRVPFSVRGVEFGLDTVGVVL